MKASIFISFILLTAFCLSLYQSVCYDKKNIAAKIELSKTDPESEDDTENSEDDLQEYLNSNLLFAFSNFPNTIKFKKSGFSSLPEQISNIFIPPPKI